MANVNPQIGQWNRTNNTFGLAKPLYNYVDNGDFSVNARKPATSVATTPGTAAYFIDRWILVSGAGTGTFTGAHQNVTNTPGQVVPSTNQDIDGYVQLTTSAGTVGALSRIEQWIPNVKMLAGKNVNLSAWFFSASAFIPKIEITQYYGSGGSPSAAVQFTATMAAALAANTWTPLVLPATLQSTSGKTFGTDNLHGTLVRVYPSSAGGVTGTCVVDLIQLEEGLNYTGFHRKPVAEEQYNAKRFYNKSFAKATLPQDGIDIGRQQCTVRMIGGHGYDTVPWPVAMVRTPTVIFYRPNIAGAAGQAYNWNTATFSTAITTNAGVLSPDKMEVDMTGPAGWAAGHAVGYQWEAKGDLSDPA